ncbi:MAG TPA: HWE histidine kinase domain-containing protein [Gammaproteobacteria bacterium]|nr:HWE histidine kinase domain-containing protein [Gammaproteobacteria bacterium]
MDNLRKQRAALADFGTDALRSDDLDALLEEACRLVSEALDVRLVKVLELLPDGDSLLVRAGINWNPGVVGHATLGAHSDSPAGYALQTCEPVISNDVENERRFAIPDLLREHRISSMVNVVIRGEGEAWGVLEVDSPRHRNFDQDDIDFLRTYANLLAFAIERIGKHRKLAEAATTRRMLLRELQHRVGNMIANIRALATVTRAYSADLDEFAAAFDKRLSALARAQTLLTRDQTDLVGIRDILIQELEAHGCEPGDRLSLRGADQPLPRKVVQALAVAVHELATNAVKYGALAADGGKIDVSWSVQPPNEMRLRWREDGVQINEQPSRRGFGSRVINEVVPHMLGGASSDLQFHPNGIECTIIFPVTPDAPGSATGLS